MLSMCTSGCIMQHHTASCNMISEVKTYEDPNSRIVLAPHEPIFLRTLIRYVKRNFMENMLTLSEMTSRYFDEFGQRNQWSSPFYTAFHDLSAELMWVFNGLLRVCT